MRCIMWNYSKQAQESPYSNKVKNKENPGGNSNKRVLGFIDQNSGRRFGSVPRTAHGANGFSPSPRHNFFGLDKERYYTFSLSSQYETENKMDVVYRIEQTIIDYFGKTDDSFWLQSPEHFALKANLQEYLKNSIDAQASECTIIFPRNSIARRVIFEDNGNGFSNDMLGNKEKRAYHEVLGNDFHIESDKNNLLALGGCGRGMAQGSEFLQRYAGKLEISNTESGGARITLSARRRAKNPSDYSIVFNQIRQNYSSMNNQVDQEEQESLIESMLDCLTRRFGSTSTVSI